MLQIDVTSPDEDGFVSLDANEAMKMNELVRQMNVVEIATRIAAQAVSQGHIFSYTSEHRVDPSVLGANAVKTARAIIAHSQEKES